MVIGELIKKAAQTLKEKGIEDSYNEALVLFTYVLDCTKTYVFTHGNESVPDDIYDVYKDYILKRSRKMPVAYIVGTAWFMSLEFKVNESTLIPRPETEGLLEAVLELLKSSKKTVIKNLDLCSGTGCIGIAAAKFDTRIEATLVDNNPGCIKIAGENIKKHNLENRVKAIKSNLFEMIQTEKYDVITANPPYINSDDIDELDEDVKNFEPIGALDGGADGMYFYKKIIREARFYLYKDGYLVLESGAGQVQSIVSLLESNGFSIIAVHNDLSGIPRVICAKRI